MDEFLSTDQRTMAGQYLEEFDSTTRARGEDYFRSGAVLGLRCLVPNSRFQADVRGSRVYRTDLSYTRRDGWKVECTCPVGFDCKHGCAVVLALLAEDNVNQVRRLSGGKASKSGPESAPAPPTLSTRLESALGRPLNKAEAAYLRKVSAIWNQISRRNHISTWDLQPLGYRGSGFDSLKIGPRNAGNEYEFWIFLARFLRREGCSFPEFMEFITEDPGLAEELDAWQRKREIEQWRQTLKNGLNQINSQRTRKESVVDMRVRFLESHAVVEWKTGEEEPFTELTPAQSHRFRNEMNYRPRNLTVEAEWIWRLSLRRSYCGDFGKFLYRDSEDRPVLAEYFNSPLLESKLIGSDDLPIRRIAEPLRWKLIPANHRNDDYRMRLETSDGQPVPDLWCALPGTPGLYLTARGLHAGPPFVDGLNPQSEVVIPAPALETGEGARLLQKLVVEQPERLKRRVRTVPLKVKFQCELAPLYEGAASEVCVVRAVAEAEDGSLKVAWNGAAWMNEREGAATRPLNVDYRNHKGEIILYERSQLDAVPDLLHPLNLRFDSWKATGVLKVTRKFPQVFFDWLRSLPKDISVELRGDLETLAKNPIAAEFKVEIEESDMDWFDLKLVLSVEDAELTPEEMDLLLKARGKWVRLTGKGWRRLEMNLNEEDDEQFARLGLNPRELSSEPQRMHALQLADPAGKRFLQDEQFERIQRRVEDIRLRVALKIPEAIQADLRPYQVEGFHFLAYLTVNRFGGVLADDMGLGKTLQALTWLAWLNGQSHEETKPFLVVCPKSVMDNWRAEAERFYPSLRVAQRTSEDVGRLVESPKDAGLHVINYHQLRQLGDSMSGVRWRAVILDEGQYIKNPNSQTARIARSLHAEHRLVLTGTPIENRLLDLWSLLAFAMPGLLGGRNHFAKIYNAKDDPFARLRLSARVRPFLLRRTKSQVAKDLPDRMEEDLYCEISGEQKTLYTAEIKRARQLLLNVKTQKQLAQFQFNFLASLLRLRQICCHPKLARPESRAAAAKLEALIERLEPILAEGHKVLVFSQFVAMLDLIRPAIEKQGWPSFYLTGKTENRGPLIESFQNAEGAAVFLISLKAGGFGLNLTAANYVVLFDPWWNPAVENQAIDRTHRIGQQNKVIAYRLLIKDSIEEKIRVLQKRKSKLAEDVLGEEKFAKHLTLEDMKFLLN